MSTSDINSFSGDFKDLFDKWWLIREVGNFQVQVENFQTGIIVNFPNLIVTEPEYLLIRYPSDSDKKSMVDYSDNAGIYLIDEAEL